MLQKNRFSNYQSYCDPFPILEIKNFLTVEESKKAVEILKNSNFDEFVMEGRKNIRKGTKEFYKFIENNKIFQDLYNFLNDKDQYLYLYNLLSNVSKESTFRFKAKKISNSFNKDYYTYKRDVHGSNFLKKIKNLLMINLPNFLRNLFSISYFEINFSLAKEGYKLKTHRDKKTRILVLLLYLNDLNENDGGFLEIYSNKNLSSENDDNKEENLELKMKIKPETGKLVAFLSNPNSYHNVSKINHSSVERYFCYGSYSSNNEIIWEKF